MTVTIEIPASVPAQIRKPEGDVGGADGLATTIDAAAGRYEEFADRCRELQDLGSWAGIAYQSYKVASAASRAWRSASSLSTRPWICLNRSSGRKSSGCMAGRVNSLRACIIAGTT